MRMLIEFTEHRGRLVIIPSSYPLGLGFKSRPRYRLSGLKFFVVLFSPSKLLSEQYLKLDHNRLHSRPPGYIND
jgi:hypothetical protein